MPAGPTTRNQLFFLELKKSTSGLSFERTGKLQVKKRKKSMTLETLLGEPDLALPLANYIDGTERFKQLLSEQLHRQSVTTSRDSE